MAGGVISFDDLLAPDEGQGGPLSFTVKPNNAPRPEAMFQDLVQPDQAPELTAGRVGGLGARAGIQGGVAATAGVPAFVTDAINSTSNLIYKGIDRAAGLAGLMVGSKDLAGANPKLAETHARAIGEPFANTRAVTEAGARLADVAGAPRPVTRGEKLAVAGGEGVVGALSGVGMGSLLARGGGRVANSVGELLRQNPVSQTIAGATSGAAAETAAQTTDNPIAPLVAGMIGGAIVPSTLPGRETIGTVAGREAAAGGVLRSRARNADRAVDRLLTAEPETPGFRFHGSDASLDPGIASLSNRLREYADDAGGMSSNLKANNNTILSEALTRHGAGQGEATRAAQARSDREAISGLELGSLPEVDITRFVRNVENNANPRATGNPEVARAFQEVLGDLRNVARFNPTLNSWFIPPAHLQQLRTVFSQRRNDKSLTNNSALRNARQESKSVLSDIDEILNQETLGDYHTNFLAPSRAGRTEADRQDFMENFAEIVNRRGREGYDPETGARNVDAGAWLGNSTIEDRPLEKGNRTTIRNLDPERQGFIRGARADINRAGFATRSRKGKNSATISNSDIDQMVTEATAAGQGPMAKVTSPLLWATGTSANALSRYATPIMQPIGRALQRGGENVLDRLTSGAETDVRRILGEAETDPTFMAHLLRRGPAYNPGFMASTGLLGVRSARNAVIQGAPAGARAEERRKRYR